MDAALGLPEGDNSYVLEDWLQRLCVKEAYEGKCFSVHAVTSSADVRAKATFTRSGVVGFSNAGKQANKLVNPLFEC